VVEDDYHSATEWEKNNCHVVKGWDKDVVYKNLRICFYYPFVQNVSNHALHKYVVNAWVARGGGENVHVEI
jgi:hypothetical protein